MKVRSAILEAAKQGMARFDAPDVFDHRGMIIRGACDIETRLTELLSNTFAKHNPNFSREKAIEDLFGENRTLGSAKKMADVCYHLDLITIEQRHDLDKVAKLRNRYAHDANRKQLDEDPEMFKLLTDTYLYKSTPGLRELPPQSILRAILLELEAQVRDANDA